MADNYDSYTREQLIHLLRTRDRKPTFGLVWERDEIEHESAINEDFVALDFDAGLSVGEAPFQNLIIEGDNFDALRFLRMTHAGRVKCIYIDPPYNTGNRDFIYNDRFIDKEDTYRHSKWLEFLFRRLELARELLSEDGVILVSINDENRAKLELLLDRVFSGMRIGSFVWRTKDTGNDAGGNFSQVHEHVLAFAGSGFQFNGKTLELGKYRNPDNDPNGPYSLDPITCNKTFKERENLYYPIYDPETKYWYPCDPNAVWRYVTERKIKPNSKIRTESMESLIKKKLIAFPRCKPEEIMWWDSKEELIKAIQEGRGPILPKKKTPLLREDLPDLDFWIGKPIAPGRPSKKSYLKNKEKMVAPVSSWIAGVNEEVEYIYHDMDEEIELLRSQRGGEGTDAITAILGVKAFHHPKPPSLIRSLIRQATQPGDVVLDFFAGSGTTAQAVLELNTEDDFGRHFVLVSNRENSEDEPDKNICRDVCAARVKNVIQGYRSTSGTGGDFAYFRTRRISPEAILSAIEHEQVWTALQLIHTGTLTPYQSAQPIQQADLDPGAMLYVPKLSAAVVELVKQAIVTHGSAVVYSWQPGMLAQYLEDERASLQPIPQFLVNRFGLGAKP
ncbi:site-specific DNA-methyltransferase [Methylomagnum ishizawai]|uniref:site-specific DNA-methyltransferase n=1 Tax=Methylomagnum ishizawai TaxID=1760988 RepID=UPI001C330C6A|nr:site-specific DNA-methyltransferase [Methylomagnum ishizawai]BBL74443.1 site-specific DNA-methyltransferase [Methylomagnum ishizawai]